MNFCRRWKENQQEQNAANRNPNQKSRNRNMTSNLSGRVKDVRKAESNGFLLPPMPELFDETINDV
jgi:hypothetical protein